MKELLLLLQDQLDTPPPSQESYVKKRISKKRPSPPIFSNFSEENMSFSTDKPTMNLSNILESLQVKQDIAEPFEANILFNLLGKQRVLAISDLTLQRLIKGM